MKKISLSLLAIILSLSSLLLLVSCGSKKSTNSDDDDNDKKEKSEAVSQVSTADEFGTNTSADVSATNESSTDGSIDASADNSSEAVSVEDNSEESSDITSDTENGNRTYTNSAISFSYPEKMTEVNGNLTDPTTGNNIIIQKHPKTSEFYTMTAEQYKQVFGAQYEAQGGKVLDVTTDTIINGNGTELFGIAITTSIYGTEIKQAIIVFDSANNTNVVIITVIVEDDAMLAAVCDSIKAIG